MTEAQIFEKIGRLQVEKEELLSEYRRLLEVVEGIKSGRIDADHVTVDLGPALSWKIEVPPPEPPESENDSVVVPATEPACL